LSYAHLRGQARTWRTLFSHLNYTPDCLAVSSVMPANRPNGSPEVTGLEPATSKPRQSRRTTRSNQALARPLFGA